jgi:protein farnesyltransferase subunit beta
MKEYDGSFRMHHGGEIDIRGTYCALNVASLVNILTPELVEGVATFITFSQSFDGGIS